jgi:hypothetical protein
MVVAIVGAVSGAQRFRRVQHRLGVALGLWIVWVFRGVFPIWIVLAAVGALIGRPVFEWLEWRIRMHERDRQDDRALRYEEDRQNEEG